MNLTTQRLSLSKLSENDAVFIQKLVNSEGWLTFIGNRNINNQEAAITYIQKINASENFIYWTVKITETNEPIGIITYIKRDYLEHHDIGFAFLSNFNGKGFAFEASKKVLEYLINNKNLKYILATTIPENNSSIHLLKKLGLSHDKEIEIDKEILHVYKASKHNLKLTN